MSFPLDRRAQAFTTEEGVELHVSVFDVGECRPPQFMLPIELEPILYLTYAKGPHAGEEEITFGLSSVRSYAEGAGICGKVDYSGEDCRRLVALAEEALAEIARHYEVHASGPRLRLSDLAERRERLARLAAAS